MKIGLCAGMNVEDLSRGGFELAPLLAEMGYDYIELSLSHLAMLGDYDLKKLITRLKQSDLPCESCNNFFPSSLNLTGTNVNWHKIKEFAWKALEIASQIGSKIVVFGSGPAKTIPDAFPKSAAYQQLIELCRLIDPIARETGIIIVIEPLRKAECNIINTVEEGLQLMNDANCSNIRMLVDYYHMRIEGENPAILLKAGQDLQHVHFAKVLDRAFPLSIEEDSQYVVFFEYLKEIGYDQLISVEAFTNNFYTEAKQSLTLIKSLLK